jgi:hypothetical protein
MSAPLLYRVPLVSRRGQGWATRCAKCDGEIHMGPGSKAAMLRLIAAVGQVCGKCRGGDQ